MNLTPAVVMMTFVLFVLSLGPFDFAFANHLRIFRNELVEKPWKNSLNDCNQKNESLVTVYDEEDYNFTFDFMTDRYGDCTAFWFGLHKMQDHVTTWSDGKPVTFNASQVNVNDRDQICEAINGTWTGLNCSERIPFMCYKDNDYILIEKEKNWCQALQYCRKHYTDLVSISNETQNNEVFQKGKNKTFWIGLQHDQWKWADNSCSTYRKWAENVQEKDCAKSDHKKSGLMHRMNYADNSNTLCSKGNTRTKVVQINATWESALNYCKEEHTGLLWIEDEEDQKAVEQWLNYTDVEGPFWIGLRQSSLFGFWIWSDRTVGYSNWENDKTPEMPMSNHCGVIIKTDKTTWKWSDESCWRELYFLCEEEIVFLKYSS